ncbi:MAG: hypothetical protein K8I82_12305 [Anaerolineae bacterium]|nr:hypothetical protein [Anaerolineae bacterium]
MSTVPFTVEKMANQPVLLSKQTELYKPAEHLENLIHELLAALDAVEEPVFIISVLIDAKLNMDDMIAAGNIQARYAHRFHEHPNYRGILYVPNPALVPHYRTVMEGLKTDKFGTQMGIIMDSLDKALAYIAQAS